LSTYASRDEHDRHYRSCAIECGWREDENWPPYKRCKAIIRENTKTQLDYQHTFHAERKTIAGIIWRATGGTKSRSLVSSGGARRDKVELRSHTTTTHTQLQGLGEEKGNFPHMHPGTSMADIIAHALPSGDVEKMKIGHPTNNPRPLLWKTRKHNSITNPPFVRKEKTSLESSGGARGDQVPFTGIIWRGTGGPSQAREAHHNNPYTTLRTWRAEGVLSTCASRDEHG